MVTAQSAGSFNYYAPEKEQEGIIIPDALQQLLLNSTLQLSEMLDLTTESQLSQQLLASGNSHTASTLPGNHTSSSSHDDPTIFNQSEFIRLNLGPRRLDTALPMTVGYCCLWLFGMAGMYVSNKRIQIFILTRKQADFFLQLA